MRILVTGGAGYIGSHAVRLFLARGHDVWVYDNLCHGHRAAVPADRLIDWHPGDGWGPLCDGLGLPVPAEPFPHSNTTDEFRARVASGIPPGK